MSFIRPELRNRLWRLREALVGVGIVGIGAWGALSTFGLTRWLFYVLAAVGVALIWLGIRRARFPSDEGGLGLVEVTERLITYLSPVGGGSISMDELIRIEIVTNDLGPFGPDLFWVFRDSDGKQLTIPGNADGTDQFFDALAALDGVDYEAAIDAAAKTGPATFLIWQKPGTGGGNVEYLPPRS